MLDPAEYVALFEFGQVEAGAEMLAVAGENDGANVIRQGVEERLQFPAPSRHPGRCVSRRDASHSTATAPRRSARSEAGRAEKSPARSFKANS